MKNRYLALHFQSQKERERVPSLGFYNEKLKAMCGPVWCPEHNERHRLGIFTAEVVLNRKFSKMTWIQREIANLSRKVICPDCYIHLVVDHAERKVLEKVLKQYQLGIANMEESEEPLRVKRGVIEELYFGLEYDELGRQVSHTFYGFGSNVAAFQRVPFVALELVELLKNLLSDADRDPETVFEKRRYVQTICEIFETHDYYETEQAAKRMWPDFDDRVFHLFESAFGLGFLAAEYKLRFPQERAREAGLRNAHAQRQKFGKKRRMASVNAANKILIKEKHLLADLPSLAKEIETMRLDSHRQKNGVYIGWEAISVHLRRALKEGKLRNF